MKKKPKSKVKHEYIFDPSKLTVDDMKSMLNHYNQWVAEIHRKSGEQFAPEFDKFIKQITKTKLDNESTANR